VPAELSKGEAKQSVQVDTAVTRTIQIDRLERINEQGSVLA
jgi:hypothetical protein